MTNTMKRLSVVAVLVLVGCAGEDLSVDGGALVSGSAGVAGVNRPPPIGKPVAGSAGSAQAGQAGSPLEAGAAGVAGATAGQAGAGQAGVEAGGAGEGGQPEAGQAGQAGQSPAGMGGAGMAGQAGAGMAGLPEVGGAGQAGAPVAGQGGAGAPVAGAGPSGQGGMAGQAGAGQAGAAGQAGSSSAGQAGAGQAGQGPVCTFDDRRCLGTQPQACQGDGQWSTNGGDCTYGCDDTFQCTCSAPAGRFTKTSHLYNLVSAGDQGYMSEVYDTKTKLTWLADNYGQMASWTMAEDFCQKNERRLPSRAEIRAVQLGQYPQTVCADNWPLPFNHLIDRVWTADTEDSVPGARWTVDTATGKEVLAAVGDGAAFRCVTDPF